jgi:hypothetical protein
MRVRTAARWPRSWWLASRSERCAWEVERAGELGKRLIPVQGAAVPEAEVPERLRRLNYIFLREGQSFARPLRELAEALRQDVEWIREHTRLSEAAARWQARDRGTGAAIDLLLRGDELVGAREWKARRKESAPEITPLLSSFLTASEETAAALANQEQERLAERERLVAERELAQQETERAQKDVRRVQRRWFAILVGLAIVVALGTGLGLWSVFNGWRDLMVTRAQFIAGVVDQQTGSGDHVDAMLIGLDALPDASSEGIRQRVLRPEMSAVNALDGAWRNWSSGWGEWTILRGHTKPVWAVAFSPDGTRVLTGSWDHTARLWDPATGKTVATLTGHTGSVMAVAFSPDGMRVLTGSGDTTSRLWESATGKPVATLVGHTDAVRDVAFSPDGTHVLTGSDDNTARLWKAATGKPVAILVGHTSWVTAVAFSPDGTRILTGSEDNTARLWEAATGRAVATLAGHTDAVTAVAFSPDGRRVLTGSQDHTARLWDAATGKVAASLSGHTGYVEAVAFLQDGAHVLTGSSDNTARVWPVFKSVFKSAQDLIDTVRTSVPRCLTPMQREAFHLGTSPPRWCYEHNLWPFADHGQPYITGGSPPPYGPPPPTWDEKLLAAWDRVGSWFGEAAAKQENR